MTEENQNCPFCGSTDLQTGSWCIDDDEAHELVKPGDLGEVPSIECNRCLGSAPAENWNRRASPWRSPPDMPPEGGRVLFIYMTDDGESDPIVGVYNKGYYETYCQPMVRWMAIKEA